ncbi:exostosin-3 [Clonorchis sinensis]|uniref:Exostosin-3 n=1 Tax=Clonorchis sinensis TaxID=79923 RepID=G7YLA1_CLOSI|nr:exostosin-3 [Clonorchis sinensis]
MKTTNNGVLRFCLNQRTDVSNSISKQLYDALVNSPLRQLSCSDLGKAHVKILVNWDDDKSCFQVYKHGFNTYNHPPCVLILPTVSSEMEFRHKRDHTTIRNSPWIIIAPSFTFGSFRTGTDLMVTTMAYLELFNRSLDATSRILLNSRSRLLTLSIGRARNEEANRTSYTNLLLHDIEKLSVDANHQEMSVVNISIHRMEKELLECWKIDTLQSMLQILGESLVWFPCASSPELLRESVFGLVPITPPSTPDGSQVNTLSWQIQLLLCLESGAIPVLVGEGQLPFPMAMGYERWSQATISISVRQLDHLRPFLLSVPAEEIEMLQQNSFSNKQPVHQVSANKAHDNMTLFLSTLPDTSGHFYPNLYTPFGINSSTWFDETFCTTVEDSCNGTTNADYFVPYAATFRPGRLAIRS